MTGMPFSKKCPPTQEKGVLVFDIIMAAFQRKDKAYGITDWSGR